MLSMTVNQVKVDAGPLITRFKDAETGNLVYAGMFSPVRWWRLWATLWVSNLLFSVVAAVRCVLFLLASPLWFGRASYLSHQCSYRI